MAGMDYNGIAGVLRVIAAGEKPEAFAIEVITFHAAIEHEVEEALRKVMPRPDALFTGSPRLGFAHKAKLLSALWQRDPKDADRLNAVLRAFQDLRDAVAHSDKVAIKSINARLFEAYREIANDGRDEYSIMEIAQGVCLFMSDGGTVDDLVAKLEGLGDLVNNHWPIASDGEPDGR